MVRYTAKAGFSVGLKRLALTDHSSGLTLGQVGDTLPDDKERERYQYRVTVKGTGIEEIWNSEEKKSTESIKDAFFDAVEDKWTDGVAALLKQDAKVEPLWTQSNSTSETRAIPLPPVPQEDREDETNTTTE